MAIVNELITKFGFIGNLTPQETFNANLKASIGLLAAMGAAIAGSAAGIAGWVASVSDTVDPMVQFSRETGVAIETIQTLGYAASVNGSSVDALQSSLAEMTKRVGEFVSTGEGEAKDVAGRLGLKFRDLNGHVKSSDVIFRDLADKLHGMSQAEKFSVLDKMGIDRSMVQLLSMTGEEISSLQNQAEALGIVTQEQADQFAAYNDSLTTLGKGFEGIKFQVAVGFVPVLKELVDGFTNFLIVNKDLIKDGLSHLGEIIFSVMGMIRRLMPIVAVATTGFIAWKIAAIGLRTVLATIFSPVVLITAAIVAIILVIDDLLTAMEGGQSVIADFFSDNWGIDIVPALNAAKAALMAFIDYAINVFKPLADAIASMFKMVWHLITGAFTGDFQDAMNDAQNVFDSLIAFITGAFGVVGDAIKYVFGDAGAFIVNVFTTAIENTKLMFSALWKLVTGAFTGDFQDAMNDAQNVFDSLIAFITGAFGVVGDAIKYVFGDAGAFIVNVFTTAIENTKLMFSALWKLVTGDFKGAWGDVVKIFDNSVQLMKKPFVAFIDWAKNLFAGLGKYIGDVISNAASNAWTATKSFFGFGDDEQPQGQSGGGVGGMGANGIPYGMPGVNDALSLMGNVGTSNNSYSFSQQNYITAPDAVAAGDAVVDRSQQQQREAQRHYKRGGR
ncbi:phage tail protein [Atlantibacter hermannii]|uniref:phage tail protein n=1 Tax=Atlantibacter hermannii TaxID=565 RepID=UPI0035B67CD2